MFFRLAVFLLLISAIGMSGYFRVKAARVGGIDRRAEGGPALLARMLVALPLLFMILVYVFGPGWLEWSRMPFPGEARVGGLLLGIVALLGSVWTLVSIGSNISPTVLTREGQRLVTAGPYRWVRHPLYASGTLLLIAMALMAENVLMLIWIAMGTILLFAIVIPREERELIQRFGAEYADYRTRTGAILPRMM